MLTKRDAPWGDTSSTRLMMLGLDPGLTNTGYAVAEVDIDTKTIIRTIELGVLTTERDTHAKIRRTSDDYRRARSLHQQIKAIIDIHAITIAACEMNSTTQSKRVSYTQGILAGIVASFDFFLIELLPRQVKAAVSGDRDAPKDVVIRWALETTRNDNVDWPTSARQNRRDIQYRAKHVTIAAEHQADALAVVYAALQSDQLQESLILQRALSRS